MTAVLLAAGHAAAQDAAPAPVVTARERFDRAVQLAREGDYAAAVVEFEAAFAASGNPAVLFNIAAANENLNRYVEALAALRRFVAEAPPALVVRRRAEITAAAARLSSRIGTLRVAPGVDGLRLEVDGVEHAVGPTGARVPLSAGVHRVRLHAPGFEPREESVEVAGLSERVVVAALARSRSAITVEANVPDAVARIDGGAAITLRGETRVEVDEGEHAVEVARAGYTTFATRVRAAQQGAHVTATLSWADEIPEGVAAHLVVRTQEHGVVTTLGRRRVAPTGDERVPPGVHVLRVSRDGFLAAERTVTLAPGATTTVDVPLAPTPAFRREYLTDARARRLAWTATGGVGATVFAGGGAFFAWSLVSLVSASDRIVQYRDGIERCAQMLICPPGSSQYGAELERAQREYRDAVALSIVSGVIVTAGVGALLAAGIVFANAPRLDRFERPGRWQVGVGDRSATLAVHF